jgi:CRP-like cAMP-binding protein
MQTFDSIKRSLDKYIDLTEDEFEIFCSYLEKQTLKKKEVFLRAGDVCRHVFFINSGCMRYFYTVDGEERIGQFFTENDWFTEYESFLTQRPSTQTIDALEPCDLLVLSYQHLQMLYTVIPKFERFGRLMAEQNFIGVKHRYSPLLNETPEARYLHLIQTRPQLIQRIPQHYLASFLGIKPESLSRIRKRIYQNRPLS